MPHLSSHTYTSTRRTSSLAHPKKLIMAISHMKFSLLPLLFLIAACVALQRDDRFSIISYAEDDLSSHDKLIDLFESWMQKHDKSYSSFKEKLRRFEIFKDNLMHIDETNKKVTSYWLGLNEFADLSHEEFKEKYFGLRAEYASRRKCAANSAFRYKDVVDLPKSVDWRKKGAVTHVKNQGTCGKNT